VLRRVRNLRDEVAALAGPVQQLSIEQRRSLANPFTPGGKLNPAVNSAETDLKLAVMETELKALKDMITELRQARDDWKAQAGHASPWPPLPPITARAPADTPSAPSALAPAPTAAPKPENGADDVLDKNRTLFR
jgi:hypothetical protein